MSSTKTKTLTDEKTPSKPPGYSTPIQNPLKAAASSRVSRPLRSVVAKVGTNSERRSVHLDPGTMLSADRRKSLDRTAALEERKVRGDREERASGKRSMIIPQKVDKGKHVRSNHREIVRGKNLENDFNRVSGGGKGSGSRKQRIDVAQKQESGRSRIDALRLQQQEITRAIADEQFKMRSEHSTNRRTTRRHSAPPVTPSGGGHPPRKSPPHGGDDDGDDDDDVDDRDDGRDEEDDNQDDDHYDDYQDDYYEYNDDQEDEYDQDGEGRQRNRYRTNDQQAHETNDNQMVLGGDSVALRDRMEKMERIMMGGGVGH